MKIVVTGGSGYIGSHTCVELLKTGHEVVVVDNLSNSKEESLIRVQKITGKTLEFHKINLLDKEALNAIFRSSKIDAVIHFAGFKAVGESVSIPLRYYHNNVTSTLILCEVMAENNVRALVFSSSATVYGDPHTVPVKEDFPRSATNPYGRSKLIIEEILEDLYKSENAWNIAILRYFNPVGAYPDGQIGEDPNGIPSNLLPYITQIAVGKLSELQIFGDDYPTIDGTGVRDFIHVVDLAIGHIKALEKLTSNPGIVTYNLGTGQGFSVLEMKKEFEKASGKKIPYRIVKRRAGDIASCYADPSKANRELDWSTQRGLTEICVDAWNWQRKNPIGYDK